MATGKKPIKPNSSETPTSLETGEPSSPTMKVVNHEEFELHEDSENDSDEPRMSSRTKMRMMSDNNRQAHPNYAEHLLLQRVLLL